MMFRLIVTALLLLFTSFSFAAIDSEQKRRSINVVPGIVPSVKPDAVDSKAKRRAVAGNYSGLTTPEPSEPEEVEYVPKSRIFFLYE